MAEMIAGAFLLAAFLFIAVEIIDKCVEEE